MPRIAAVVFSLLVTASTQAALIAHGPITGGVTDTSAVVWLRCNTLSTVEVLYSTSPDGPWTAVLATRIGPDYTFEAMLTGLLPSTRYYVGAQIGGLPVFRDPQSSFLTAPPSDQTSAFEVLVMTDFESRTKVTGESPSFASATGEGASLLFIGGDFDHRHSNSVAKFRRVYRDMYNEVTVGLATFVPQILRQMGIGHQWDDHDLGANNCDRTTCLSGFGFTAYQEFVPHYPFARLTSIWQKFRFGQAEFFILDDRTQRDPVTQSPRSMLGADQLAWLLDGLEASTATWKVVFSSVPLNPTAKPTDSWGAYLDERQQILDRIATKPITGVVVVSGDLHIGAIDDGTTSGVPEMVVPSPDADACQTGPTDPGTWSEGTYINPDRHGPCQGYGLLVFGTDGSLELVVRDETGATRLSYTIF